jgi:hypothetical protein
MTNRRIQPQHTDLDAERRAGILRVVRELHGATLGETVAKLSAEIIELRWRLSAIERTIQGNVASVIGYGPHDNREATRNRDFRDLFFITVVDEANPP